MTTRHSLLTRGLSLVLALVMVLGNLSGLTMEAKAAESTLFDVIKGKNPALDAVLEHIGGLTGLEGYNTPVSVDEKPEKLTKEDATLINGSVIAKAVGKWIPTDTDGIDFELNENGEYIAKIDPALQSVTVTYTQDLGVDEDAGKLFGYVSSVAGVVAADNNILADINDGLDGLSFLGNSMLGKMSNAITTIANSNPEKILGKTYTIDDLDELGITSVEAEGVTVEINLAANEEGLYDIDGNGTYGDDVDLKLEEKINAKIAEKVAEKVAAEAAIRKGYIVNIRNRMVKDGDPFMDYVDEDGFYEYEGYLRLYAMLSEYSKHGIAYFYQDTALIKNELKYMAEQMNALLGYDPATGVAANAEFVDAIIEEMGKTDSVIADAGIDSAKLVKMAARMNKWSQLRDGAPAAINSTYANLEDLCADLAACGDVTGMSTSFIQSAEYAVADDSIRLFKTTIGGKLYTYAFINGDTLDELEVRDMMNDMIAFADAMHYYFHEATQLELQEKLIGHTMNEEYVVEDCGAVLAVYDIVVENSESKIEVPGNATTITLPFVEGHEYKYEVNGETVEVKSEADAVIELAEGELNVIAGRVEGEKYTVKLIEDINVYKNDLDALVDELNKKIGEGSFKLIGTDGEYTGLIAEMTMGDISIFGQTVLAAGFKYINLNNEQFIADNKVSLQALIDALMADDTFSSEKLIALGQEGKGNLLNSTMQLPGYDLDFQLNLTTVPAQMSKVSAGLNAVKNYMTFTAGNGQLDVDLDIPEKVYEAYLSVALLTHEITKGDTIALNNTIAMEFVADYFDVLRTSDATTQSYTNTLKMLGINRDLTGYEDYYQLIKTLVSNEQFSYTIEETALTATVGGKSTDLGALLAVFGLSLEDLTSGVDVIEREILSITSVFHVDEQIPEFEAAIIDPSRLNDNGWKNKAMAANYTTDLVKTAASIEGGAAIMLLDNVTGNLTFNSTTILDLNGNTITGNIVANAPLYIVDSSLDSVSGGGVDGEISGDVRILSGTYTGNVEALLKDGYYLDNGSVVNAMYQIKGGKILVDPKIYVENVDGYLPAVHYLAADLAIDLALNYYFAGGLYAEGKANATNMIYNISFEDLVALASNKSLGLVADEVLACISAPGISDFINKVIEDLLNFPQIATALDKGTNIATYNFSVLPWAVTVEHITDGDYMTFGVVPNQEDTKNFSLNLALDLPEGQTKKNIMKVVNALAEAIVLEETCVEVQIDQPVRDGKNLIVGGKGNGVISLDFSSNSDYNRMLGAVLAYFNADLTDELVKNGCIVDLNEIMSKVTVGDFFSAVKKAVEGTDVPFAKIAEEVGLTLSDAAITKLEDMYDTFQAGVGKVIAKFELDTDERAPLSDLADGDGAFIVHGDVHPRTVDAFYRGFGIIANLSYSDLELKVKLAPKCTKIIGDANSDGVVDTFDAALILRYNAELIDESGLHMCVSDVNDDGVVDTFDAAMILRYCAELIDSFPAEAK